MWRQFKSVDAFAFPEIHSSRYCHRMPQMNKRSKETNISKEENDPISLNKHNNIIIQVLAKPGAKQNAITGITEDGVGIQINAPPSDGEANAELVKYVSNVLRLHKNDVVFEKGFKSRSKKLKIVGNISIEEVRRKISEEIGS
ncbi:unnamed protein product [Phaedon cochleariae]|uniref:Uncharacterized protein n=1 Tax=Phaedon cochleariae TaxID=80249 RepID=A0A9N9SEL7_PHACE|nr:unnamed protein product [Phaedon cochleariae]